MTKTHQSPWKDTAELRGGPQSVVLRNERTQTDIRYLNASFNDHGDVVIYGQDIGDGVEDFFGCREYEWTWTILAGDISALAKALGARKNLLAVLKHQFEGDQAAGLGQFLKDKQISYRSWSRIGD
jgi:hypothetical protein